MLIYAKVSQSFNSARLEQTLILHDVIISCVLEKYDVVKTSSFAKTVLIIYV